jgi:hypothetical protein
MHDLIGKHILSIDRNDSDIIFHAIDTLNMVKFNIRYHAFSINIDWQGRFFNKLIKQIDVTSFYQAKIVIDDSMWALLSWTGLLVMSSYRVEINENQGWGATFHATLYDIPEPSEMELFRRSTRILDL